MRNINRNPGRPVPGTLLAALLITAHWLVFAMSHASAAVISPGEAFNGPHAIPGTIPAEDFNSGASRGAYFMNVPGNDGNSDYRDDAPDVNCHSDGDSLWVSFSNPENFEKGLVAPYPPELEDGILTSDTLRGRGLIPESLDKNSAYNFGQPEWLNYTIEAETTGWYELTARIRTSDATRLQVSLNDRALGSTSWLSSPSFEERLLTSKIRITEGTHLLKILKRIPRGFLEIDWIRLEPVSAPSIEARLIDLEEETIVAMAVATEPPFSADPTGIANASPAINAALSEVRAAGGGVVYLPPGRYRLASPLIIPGHTSLYGADSGDPIRGRLPQTLLVNGRPPMDDDESAYDAAALIQLAAGQVEESNSALKNLAIWYPDQDPQDVKHHPFAIHSGRGNACHIHNITLYGAYNGIRYDFSSAIRLQNIRGTVLRRGFQTSRGFEYSQFTDIHFANHYWAVAPSDVITNAPQGAMERAALDDYTSENLVGVRIGANDGGQFYAITAEEAYRPIEIGRLPDDPYSFYGILSKIGGEVHKVGQAHRIPRSLHYVNTDDIPETAHLVYEFATPRKPARVDSGSLKNVWDFGADATGILDDTDAIQAALDEAGAEGGGTVFLPPGQYRLEGTLRVPSGVELRGPLGTLPMGSFNETCIVASYHGYDSANPFVEEAAITLEPGAGLRGFKIVYPEQGLASEDKPIIPFPFTVRTEGADCWLWDFHVSAGYNIADFATFRSDHVLVAHCWANALNVGFQFGGGSSHAQLERTQVSYGGGNINRLHQNSPTLQGTTDEYIDVIRQTVEAFRFGDVEKATSFAANSWEVRVHMVTHEEDGAFLQEGDFWQQGGEASLETAFRLRAGGDLRFIGPSRGGGIAQQVGDVYSWMEIQESFSGRAHGYGPMLWGQGWGPVLDIHAYSQYRQYEPYTLAADAVPSASGVVNENEPARALDRNPFTKWVDNGEDLWLRLDFPQPVEFDRWVLMNANSNPFDSKNFNTRAAELWSSVDGDEFDRVAWFANNIRHYHDNELLNNGEQDPRRARAVRVDVIQPMQDPAGTSARIPQLLIYGRDGWNFRDDAEGWTPGNETEIIGLERERVYLRSTGSDPSLVSESSLGIPLSHFDRVHVRMKNQASRTFAQLFFATTESPSFAQERSAIQAHARAFDGAYRDYIFDFSDNPQWQGELDRLRLDPGADFGDYAVETIRLVPQNRRMLSLSATPGGRAESSLNRLFHIEGTKLRLSADPDPGYEFAGWTGDVAGGEALENPLLVTLDGDLAIEAVFEKSEEPSQFGDWYIIW